MDDKNTNFYTINRYHYFEGVNKTDENCLNRTIRREQVFTYRSFTRVGVH